MRLEIIVLAALAALASAAPQWPYRDSVAPYYYGYPGKTPYMYRSNDEDDEMDETYLARQDLKVATSDGGSTVVVEDDEKADGVRVVETGSAKPVAQSGNNNQVQQDQQPAAQSSSSQAQAQQPLNNNANNANNAQQQTATNNGQPLTVQQPGQQPPAFPPARPNQSRPQQRPAEEEDEEDDDEDSEEDDEDAEDDEDDGDDDDEDEDEEDDEDRKRMAGNKQDNSGSGSEEPAVVPQPIEIQPIAPVVNSDVSDEVAEEPVQPVSQQAVVNNKVIKNKQSGAVAAAVASEKPKKKVVNAKAKNPSGGAIEALVPGYVTDQGEVLVPVDTVTGNQPITIVPDPFSPPSRIVAGPRPIPQSAVPSTPSRQVPYWYRSNPVINPLTQDIPTPLARQTLYSAVPPPGSIFTFDDDDDDEDTPAVIPGQRLRQDAADDDDDDNDDEDEEADQKAQAKPQKVPLAAVPAVGNSNEDDEAEALAFVNTGKPTGNRRPQSTASSTSTSGNKKPATGSSTGGANQGTSNESESEEDESDERDEEDEEDEEEDEEDDSARRENSSGRMLVDEEYVSFPPSRSPTLFAVIQGRFPYGQPNRQPQSQVFSTPNPNNPFQRYVVRVTPSNRAPRPPVSSSSPVYYRPLSTPIRGGGSPNRRVVPVASFDVSVEDTRPSGISAGPSSIIVDSEEEGDSYPGRPTPVTSYPFVYKVQGSVQGLRLPSGGPGPRPGSYGAIRPPRPSAGPPGPYGSGPGPYGSGQGPYGPYGPPPYSILSALYGGSGGPSPYGPRPSHSFGPPRPSGISGGPPVIIRKKPSGGSNRPPKPHLIAVYNPTGPSGPGPREPVDEEYYTFEVPETENKFVPGKVRPPPKNKRPTVHRKPTPVIKQKQASEDEENSDESGIAPSPPGGQVLPIKIIPHGTVRRRIRGGKQLKTKKNAKKTYSTSPKKQQNEDQHDPLGLLSKINKSKSKLH